MKSCVLVIDAQVGFLNDYTRASVPEIVSLLESTTNSLFTRFVNVPGSYHAEKLQWPKMFSGPEVALIEELSEFVADSQVFDKSCYSAFGNSSLFERLQKLGTERLELCGFDTDACVLATALDAIHRGFEVTVHLYACGSSGGLDYHEKGASILTRLLGERFVLRERTNRLN